MTTRHFITTDGLRLAYRVEGQGLPLVCLPGLTRNGRDFDYLAAWLPDGLRLVRPDYRGRGASEHDPDWRNYTVAVEARDVLELMDHLRLRDAAIIGTSRGGLIAMVLAATAKERLRGVLLNDIGPVVEDAGLARIADYVGRPPQQRSHAEMRMALPGLMPGFRDVPESRWAEEVERHYVETADGLALTYDPRLREALLASAEAQPADLWGLFEALDPLPLAVIRGANSDLLSHETLIEMQRRRPDMIAAEVPGRAHIPFLDEPESRTAILRFLAAVA